MLLRWHRIGLSIKGDSITLVLDCAQQITRKFERGEDSRVSTLGLILSGRQLKEDEEFFIGDMQLLMIANTPDEAYDICSKYAPDCRQNRQSGKNSSAKLTASRTSSRFTSTRINSKKKKLQTNNLPEYGIESSTDRFGHLYLTNQNEETVQLNTASNLNRNGHWKLNAVTGQSNGGVGLQATSQVENTRIASVSANGSNATKFEGDNAYEDYFDSIDESFYDENNFVGNNISKPNDRIGKARGLRL